MKLAALHSHPTTPSLPVRKLEAGATLEGKALRLRYRLDGQLEALKIPAQVPPRRGKELWRHTCLEAFVRAKGAPGYVEINLSPSREWDAYRFSAYREGGVTREQPVTRLDILREPGGLQLDATIALDHLSPSPARPLLLALTAVIEDAAGAISYWSLNHASGKPDFHHADGFVLEL